MMGRWLVSLGLWIARRGGWRPCALPHLPEAGPIRERAVALTLEWEGVPVSGEYKRHQVYARLIKEFPEAAHRDLALEIELALR